MSVLQSFALQLSDQSVRPEQAPQHVLHVFEGGILSHPRGHVLGTAQQPVDLLPQLSRLDSRPRHVPQLAHLVPDARERRPDGFQVA